MKHSSLQSLWMIAASFLFACMGVCVKLAAEHHSAAEIVFWRSAVSLVAMAALVRWRGIDLRTPVLRLQVSRGLIGFVSLALYFLAIVLLPLATAVTLNYTSPLFLAVFLAVIAGVRLRAALLAALGVGLVGIAVLLRPTLGADQMAGGLVAIGSGCMAGLAYFNVRELAARGEPDARTVFYFSLTATVCAAVWMLFADFHPVDARSLVLLVGCGVFATLAQLAMTRAYRKGKTLVSASLAYTTVVFASLFGVSLWGEVTSTTTWLGIALIVASGIAATVLARGPEPVSSAHPRRGGDEACPTPARD